MAIIEAAVSPETLTPVQILARARQLGLQSSESSVDIIRADRERDHKRD